MLTIGAKPPSGDVLHAKESIRAENQDDKAATGVLQQNPIANRSTETISGLARLLADSAADMEHAYRSMTRDQLAELAKSFHDELALGADPKVRKARDSEEPRSEDAEVRALAKKATAFVQSAGQGAVNPFAGLTREQLDNVIYDDNKRFTFNERVAAYYEVSTREEKWRQRTCALGIAEYNSTGKMTGFFKSCLEQFNQLPQIEKAQYPEDYAPDLQKKIKLNFNYREHRPEGKADDKPMSLIEMILAAMPQMKRKNGELWANTSFYDIGETK